jgi:hypothetical protein
MCVAALLTVELDSSAVGPSSPSSPSAMPGWGENVSVLEQPPVVPTKSKKVCARACVCRVCVSYKRSCVRLS